MSYLLIDDIHPLYLVTSNFFFELSICDVLSAVVHHYRHIDTQYDKYNDTIDPIRVEVYLVWGLLWIFIFVITHFFFYFLGLKPI